jgi:hypothetical protein
LTERIRFYNEYQEPLGRGRMSAQLVKDELSLKADRPGFTNLAVNLLDVGLGRHRSFTFEEVQKWVEGNWYLELEPGSPALSFVREGLALGMPDGFVYEPPQFEPNSPLRLESVPKFAAGIEGTVEDYNLFILADAASLISFAKRFFYLAQPDVPSGEGITYKQSYEPDPKVSRAYQREPRISKLGVERASFPQEVPWATLGSSKA